MTTPDPEYIADVVAELRRCHDRLFLAPDDRPAAHSTYSIAADLIEELAAEVARLDEVIDRGWDPTGGRG